MNQSLSLSLSLSLLDGLRRRHFLGLGAALGGCAHGATASSSKVAPKTAPDGKSTWPFLLPFSVVEGALALTRASGQIAPALDALLANEEPFAHAAAGLLADEKEARALLAQVGKGLAEGASLAPVKKSALSTVVFSLLHHEAEAVLTAHAGELDADTLGIYQDVAFLRAGSDAALCPEGSATPLLQAVEQRLFIRVHTFEPDAKDVRDWIERLVQWRQAVKKRLGFYAQVMESPDAKVWDWVSKGASGLPVMSSDDPIYRALDGAGVGEVSSAAQLKALLDQPPTSLWGKAVAQTAQALLQIDADLRKS